MAQNNGADPWGSMQEALKRLGSMLDDARADTQRCASQSSGFQKQWEHCQARVQQLQADHERYNQQSARPGSERLATGRPHGL